MPLTMSTSRIAPNPANEVVLRRLTIDAPLLPPECVLAGRRRPDELPASIGAVASESDPVPWSGRESVR